MTITTPQLSTTELAGLFRGYIDIFYGNKEGDALAVYGEYAEEMKRAGYCAMTYYETGEFRKV